MLHFLIIDNYDSFTYNLVHLCHEMLEEEVGHSGRVEVYRPDELTLAEIATKDPVALIISPGPGNPSEAVFSKSVIRQFGETKPILGVCLGHQCIAECFGATVVRGAPVHGKKALIHHEGQHPLFQGVASPMEVVRYHSLQVDPDSVGDNPLKPLAWTEDGIMMALEVTSFPQVWGVQFHPESIGSQDGKVLMRNFYRTASKLDISAATSASNVSSCSRQ